MVRMIGNPIASTFEINSEVYPGYKSFILIQGEKAIEARKSLYGLSPSWPQKKVKFSTYNARSETIFEKPT
jgi:putative SOS response-associated peptidase YedK